MKKSSDYNIFKIRYYADGINVRKGKFDCDDKQHRERAQEYNKLFWEMFEKVTGSPANYWRAKYFLSSKECAIEALHEKYDIMIPESEEYQYWFIPKSIPDISEWIKNNCKLPFKIIVRSPYSTTFINRGKTTWRREDAEEFTKNNLPNLK